MTANSVLNSNTALAGAIDRAMRLPSANDSEFNPMSAGWEDDGVWFGDWGKSTPEDFKPSKEAVTARIS
jgi:hypothetical protein